MIDRIKKIVRNSINVKELIYSDNKLIEKINEISNLIINCFQNEGKVVRDFIGVQNKMILKSELEKIN